MPLRIGARLTLAGVGVLLAAAHTADAAPLTPVLSAPVVMAQASDGPVLADGISHPTFLDAAGNQLVFEATGETGKSELHQWWVVGSDGSGLRRLPVADGSRTPNSDPVPSADGARFAYWHFARRASVSVVDVKAGTVTTSTFTGRRLWAPRDANDEQYPQLMTAADGGFYAYGDFDGLLRVRGGASRLEAVPIFIDGKPVPRVTRTISSGLPDTRALSRSAGALGVCRSYGPSARGSRDALGLLDQRTATLRLRTVRGRTNGRTTCLVSDDGTTVAETSSAGTTLIALRHGRLRRVALGPFSDLHSISPSGRYVLALRKRLTSAVAKLVDLDTGRSRVLAGATVRYSDVDDPSEALPHDDLVRWTPDERTIVLNAGTELFAADVASGRTLRLSIPPLPHPVYFLRLETMAGDGRTVFVTSHHEVGAAYGFTTPVTQTSGAQLVIARPLPDEGTLSRSRDGNRVLFAYFGPDEQDPRQDLMVGSDPAVFSEPWTLPSG